MGFNTKPTGFFVTFLAVAQVAFSLTIVIIIARQLWPGAGYYTVCNTITGVCGTVYWDSICLMDDSSANICAYGYATGAIGILVALFGLFAACLPALITILFSLFLSLWWLAFSITATVYNNKLADDFNILFPDGFPRGHYRNCVIALSFTTFACALLSCLLGVVMAKQDKPPPIQKLDDPPTAGAPPTGAAYAHV